MATRTIVNRQIRSFAFVWTGITLTIGVAVFFAIYLTYDTGNAALAAAESRVSLPLNNNNNSDNSGAPAVVAQPSPTEEIPTTPTPAMVAAAQAGSQPEEAQSTPIGVTPLSSMSSDNQAEVTPQPTPRPIEQRDEFFVGVQVQYSLDFNPDNQRVWMNDVRNLGLNWFKQQVRWDEIEREPDVYDWSKLDLVVPVAEEYDMNVVASVVAAPAWAREPGVDTSVDGPPADYQDFADFLTEMLERYPGAFQAIEVWNEPNIDREWMSAEGVSAASFVDLLRVAYTTIKNIDPSIIVISGAPSPTGGFVDQNGVVRAIDDFDYMDQMIAAGLLNYADCIGAHHNGYNVPPDVTWDNTPNDPDALFRGPFDNPHHSWSFRSTLQTYANKIAVADGDQKLCVTEFGWASVADLDGYPPNFEFALDNTLEEQAEFTVEALNLMEEWDIVWIAIIWNLNYGPQAGWSTDSDNTPYSLIGPGFTRRPAFDAIAAWSAERNQASN
ncbi:MAG: hypothetical protein ACOCX5_00240 [Chloroflexota bacterium]